jgi:hypothetical protein
MRKHFGQLVWRHGLKLRERARLRPPIRAPASKMRHVPESP